jgi:hypothetical protein
VKTNDIASAILSKIELIFSDQDSFITFPIPSLPFTSRDLAFQVTNGTSGLTPQEALTSASSFARLTNLIPDVSRKWSSDGRVVWSIYEIVLNQAVLASDNTTAAEGEELEKARDFLYEQEDVDTDKLSKYKLYRNSYVMSQYEYNAMKTRAENSSDPTVKSDWVTIEPLKKSSLDQTFQDWISKGFKGEVEAAFATIEQITGRSPRITWEKWKNDFKRSIVTDLTGQNFYQTYFYPDNFYDSVSNTSWITIQLDLSDIQNLNSTPGISSILPLDTGDQFTIESLSIEIVRVSIIRPWLEPSLFRSKFWQLPGGFLPLSDGADPPKGDLSTYISEAIFVRNLTISFDPTVNMPTITSLQGGGTLEVGSFSFKSSDLLPTNNLLKSDKLQMIGFICQKTAKSPNPDMTLDWAGLNFTFPMHGEKEDTVATGQMKTQFTIDSNGSLNADTRTWTNNSLVGFKGGVFIGLTDSFKTIIWKTNLKTFGVNGALIGGNDRTEVWQDTVPSEIFRRARGYVIIHEHAPNFPTDGWLKTKEGKKFIRNVVEDI